MIIGLSNPSFKGFTLLYSELMRIYFLIQINFGVKVVPNAFLILILGPRLILFCIEDQISREVGNQAELSHTDALFQRYPSV